MASFWDAILAQLNQAGVPLELWALAWARLLPAVIVIPAFGAKMLPGPGRAVLALSMAFVIAPALAPSAESSLPFVLRLLGEFAGGLPVALSAAALLWAATMAGGLFNDLTGIQAAPIQVLEQAGPIGTLSGLFAGIGFLRLGGVDALLTSLSRPTLDFYSPLARAAFDVVAGIEIAFALAAPVLAVAMVWELVGALIAKAAMPAHVQSMLAPLRGLVVITVLAVCLPAMFRLVSRLIGQNLG